MQLHRIAPVRRLPMAEENVHWTSIKRRQTNGKNGDQCQYCGGGRHMSKEKCPPWGETCGKSKKRNHFASVCRSRSGQGKKDTRRKEPWRKGTANKGTINVVYGKDSDGSNSSDDYSDESLYVITDANRGPPKRKKLYVPIKMHTDNHLPAREVTWQIDTGSTCNVIGFNDLCKVLQDGTPKLKESHAKLRFFDGFILKPIGKCQIHCNWKTNSVDLEFQVVDVRRKALLSAEASQLLGLVTIHIEDEGDEVNNMEAFWNGKPPMPPLDKEAILKGYGDAFDDLGCLPGKYHIETEPTVKASQNPPQRVPIATKSAIKKMINQMIKEGILANVSEPPDWVSNMVTAKKSNGDLRICIDPSYLK